VILIVCGVSGTGKTTIGTLLSEALNIPFFDADDFHPASNIEKMAGGYPLDDEDRRPWLETLAGNLPAWEKEGGAVLACSALKESYRATLGARCSESTRWIVLYASEAVLAERLTSRKGHFFDQQLLSSQLDAFEMPDYGWLIDVNSAPEEIISNILTRLCGK
jgi:6-phosphogluconate dehydrogenase/gluconokinase